MIVAETAAGYQFVTQPDHAALAGQFADHWGREEFDRPEPFAPVVLAAYAHDDGWRDYDRRPHLDGAGHPVDFRDMPPDVWIDLYDDGIDAVAETDIYAGLLVSMHGAGLRNQRYGLSAGWPETPPEFEDFVEREHRRQDRITDALLDATDRSLLTAADRRLLQSLRGSAGVPDDYDGRLWGDYRRLQVWDELSLAFCLTDSPPGYDEIGGVPTTGTGAGATLSITPVDPNTYHVDPYPFDTAPLDGHIPYRTVDDDAVTDAESLVDAYYDAGRETRPITLVRGEE